MFKNRAAQVTFVKTPKTDSTDSTTPRRQLTDVEIFMIKDAVQKAGMFVVASAIVLKFTDAICTIAVNAAPKK